MSEDAKAIDSSGGISREALESALDNQDKGSEDTTEASPEGAASATEEVVPPEHWSEEDKAAYVSLPPEAREVLHRFDGNFTKGIQEKSEALKRYEDAFKPYASLYAGTEPTEAVQKLFRAQQYLQQNPVEAIKWLANSYQVADQLFASKEPSKTEGDEYTDPEVKRLRQELEQAKDEQAQKERQAQQRQQQEQLAMIESFKSEKDEAGNLLHEHFDDLQPIMAGLLSAGRATTLEDAYSQAVKAHPTYLDAEVERRMQEAKDKAERERKEAADKADKASQGANGKSDAKATKTGDSWQEDLKANFEKSERGEL